MPARWKKTRARQTSRMLLYNSWSQRCLLSRLCAFSWEGEATTARLLDEQDCLGWALRALDVVHHCTAFGLRHEAYRRIPAQALRSRILYLCEPCRLDCGPGSEELEPFSRRLSSRGLLSGQHGFVTSHISVLHWAAQGWLH